MSSTTAREGQGRRAWNLAGAALAGLAVACFAAFAVRYVIPSSTFYIDEGWAADIGAQLAEGRVLYRDVSAPYGPVTFYLYALAIAAGGKSFFFLRLCGLALILLAGGIAFLAARRLTGSNRLAAVAPLLLYVTLGTYQGDRITASTTACLFTLLAVYCHGLLLEGRRGWAAWGLGAALGLNLLTKQNAFVFDAAAHGLTMASALMLLTGRARREYAGAAGRAAAGCAAVFLGFALFAWPFFGVVIRDTVGMVGGYVSSAGIPFPWPWRLGDAGWPERLRAAAFFCPLLLGAAAAAAAARERSKVPQTHWLGLGMTGLVAVFQFGQMFPLSDVSHYVRASAAVPVLGAALLGHCLRGRRWALGGAVVLTLALHTWPALESLYWTLRGSSALPASGLPCNEGIKKDLREETLLRVLARLREYGKEPVFVAGHHGYLYFLTGRPHVTRQSSASPYYVHSAEEERQIIGDMERAGVRHVVVGPEMFPNTGIDKMPVLSEHLQRCYAEAAAEGPYRFLDRKPCQ